MVIEYWCTKLYWWAVWKLWNFPYYKKLSLPYGYNQIYVAESAQHQTLDCYTHTILSANWQWVGRPTSENVVFSVNSGDFNQTKSILLSCFCMKLYLTSNSSKKHQVLIKYFKHWAVEMQKPGVGGVFGCNLPVVLDKSTNITSVSELQHVPNALCSHHKFSVSISILMKQKMYRLKAITST